MNLTVADLFHENSRTWDREKIQRLLPQWTKTIMTIKPSITGAPDKQVWLSTPSGESCLPPTGIVSGQLAPWILWQIWCARNQLVFEGKTTSAEETMTKAMSMAREWTNSQ
ncbi:unnamed protein product, partial [Brassica rapa]